MSTFEEGGPQYAHTGGRSSGNEWLFARKEGEGLTFPDVMSERPLKRNTTFFACLKSVGLFCGHEGNVKTRNLWPFVSLLKIS